MIAVLDNTRILNDDILTVITCYLFKTWINVMGLKTDLIYEQYQKLVDLQRVAEQIGNEASLEVIWRLTAASEYRDNETGEHIKRMSHFAAAIAQKMGLKKKTVETILNAAPMHDIGKIGIPDRILQKPSQLDEDEWQIMKTHTTIGADILAGSNLALVRMGRIIALTHHEKYDGSGYPQGLKGNKIPLIGRIVALADVFDALTSERPYKEAFTIEYANRIIYEGKGLHFDPDVVDAFFSIKDTILQIKAQYQEKENEFQLPATCNIYG